MEEASYLGGSAAPTGALEELEGAEEEPDLEASGGFEEAAAGALEDAAGTGCVSAAAEPEAAVFWLAGGLGFILTRAPEAMVLTGLFRWSQMAYFVVFFWMDFTS